MPNPAQDQFETYYAEKIWELIPEIYRHEDGEAENPGVLRAWVELVAVQAARLRRSQDRVWEDQFIEWCELWAIPYLADLVGARLVSALNTRGRRVDVAKTIYYRRRKGTPRVLEELVSDIAGWEGKLVESFRRLGRARHGLDPAPQPYAGRHSGTLPGGWADLRRPLGAQLTQTAFDEYHYTPDVRRHRGQDGCKNIPKLAFHLYRMHARTLLEVTPFQRSADPMTFTLDPSGRDTAIFNCRQRLQAAEASDRDWSAWQTAQPWELPMPMQRRLLGHAEYQIDAGVIAGLGVSDAAKQELSALRGQRFADESRLKRTLQSLPHGAECLAEGVWKGLLTAALTEDCGQAHLIPQAVEIQVQGQAESGLKSLPPCEIAAGNLTGWTISQAGKRCVLDPELGRLKFFGETSDHLPDTPQAALVSYHYALGGSLGAGTYDRSNALGTPTLAGISGGGTVDAAAWPEGTLAQIDDSRTYTAVTQPPEFLSLSLQAANGQRPYLRLNEDWVFRGKDEGAGAVLLLDGLWIGASGPRAIILEGSFETVTLRHCTLDPGGRTSDGAVLKPVPLVVRGSVETLIIDACITAAVRTEGEGIVEFLKMQDSLVQAKAPVQVLEFYLGEADLKRTTVLGTACFHRLWASEVLGTGAIQVTDTQNGCFRFSAAGKGSRLPHSYESHSLADTRALFTSTVFGHWGYGQLAETAPEAVRCGAENGSELGVFSKELNPIKQQGLQNKVDEYMPFGLIPIYLPEV